MKECGLINNFLGPMKLIVSLEQKRFFNRYLLLETEGLLSSADCTEILYEIKTFFSKDKKLLDSNKKEKFNLNRSVPLIKQILVRRKLGALVADLLNKKNLWLVFSGFFSSPVEINTYRPEYPFECGLLIHLSPKENMGKGAFFKEHMLNIPEDEEGLFLVLMFTYRSLNQDLAPQIA